MLETAPAELHRRIDELAWEVGFAAGLVTAPLVVTKDMLANPIITYIKMKAWQYERRFSLRAREIPAA